MIDGFSESSQSFSASPSLFIIAVCSPNHSVHPWVLPSIYLRTHYPSFTIVPSNSYPSVHPTIHPTTHPLSLYPLVYHNPSISHPPPYLPIIHHSPQSRHSSIYLCHLTTHPHLTTIIADGYPFTYVPIHYPSLTLLPPSSYPPIRPCMLSHLSQLSIYPFSKYALYFGTMTRKVLGLENQR